MKAVSPLVLHPHRAYWRGVNVKLTVAELAIVRCLALHSGHDVGYRELYDMVRGPAFATGRHSDGYRYNVHAFIRRIRKKFRELDAEFEQIEIYPGYGYCWRQVEYSGRADVSYVLCEVG